MQLTGNVKVLGNGYFNFFIVGRKTAALVECGTRAGAAVFRDQWTQLEEKPEIKYIVALHSHFDHIGGYPVLKQMFPEAKLVASAPAKNILAKEKANKVSFAIDEGTSELYVKHGLLHAMPDAPAPTTIPVDMVAGEGDQLEIEPGVALRFFDAPGHTVCSIAAYVEPDQVMLISDAGGYRVSKDFVTPVFFQEYDAYIKTLEKLMAYPTRAVGVAHGEIPVGDEAEQFYRQAIKAAQDGFAFIEKRLKEGATEDELANELFDKYIVGGMALYPAETMRQMMYVLIKNVKAKL
ncbi:MAG TPA: MBL fold metallo-hydrolase [Syntrophothermus lipocalidus]|uniref:MBL fold metallo-hydrolase n=1 Tax=Syntrophothermus sp. TaxID=2736299 RepID=UPI001827942E|nr:MBL fold metallo-hydrolase [Syntrophothermus sp.]NSW83005.1 MBL fold metallo-hydrolase [Syntrophothermus sp.]HHV75765.1 MBL fold metallo-hydrolase [Syntrophothermus lipocalidus]